jgi:hypothetical protein
MDPVLSDLAHVHSEEPWPVVDVFSPIGHWTQIERAEEFSTLVANYVRHP